jgi:hypothetical protein
MRERFETDRDSATRPANELSALGARLGLLSVNRDRAPIFCSQPNQAETELQGCATEQAKPSKSISEPRPRFDSNFSVCLSSARKSRYVSHKLYVG